MDRAQRNYFEYYKCSMLTVIAGILCWHQFISPTKVRVASGYIDVDNTVRVDVGNTVDVKVENTVDVEVKNTVDVEGEVKIKR